MNENKPKQLPFSLQQKNDGLGFSPYLYPERIEVVRDKELERVGADCDGQRVNIKQLKNSEIHISGKAQRNAHQVLDVMSQSTRKCDLVINTINRGLEVYIKKVKLGDMEQFISNTNKGKSSLSNNNISNTYMGPYTIDLVSTGLDEYGDGSNSGFEP